MTKTVRKEVEPVGDSEMVIEVMEDSPTSNRVSITLVSKGDQGEIAVGRVNMGQVFRRQTRSQAESLVDAVLGFIRAAPEEGGAVDAAIRAKVTGAAPTPVKARVNTATQGAGIELDHFTRKDLGETLRKLADLVETNAPGAQILVLDIQPAKGGGKTISFTVRLA
jgi:hypothetical protein